MGFFDDSDDELEANVAEAPRALEPPPPAPQQVPPPQPPPSALAPAAAPKSLHEILRIAREKEREMERARERAASEAAPAANRKGKRPAVAAPAASAPAATAAPAASAPAAAAAASKRPRVVEVDGTLVVGDDSALPEADAAEWRDRVAQLTRAGEQWVDESFPACALSIRGKATLTLTLTLTLTPCLNNKAT